MDYGLVGMRMDKRKKKELYDDDELISSKSWNEDGSVKE